MSTTSIENGFVISALSRDSHEAGGYSAGDDGAARRGRSLLKMLWLASWRRQVLETFVFLAVIAVAQRRLFSAVDIPGLPHPYWLPVLLASCQYGMATALPAGSAICIFINMRSWPTSLRSGAGAGATSAMALSEPRLRSTRLNGVSLST